MKKIFTLLTSILFVFGLMGQNTGIKSELRGHKSEVFKILKTIMTNNPEFSNQVFSVRETKQAMDSMIYEEFHEFDEGWRNDEKQVFFWNENGQEIMNTTSGWMYEEQQWYDYFKTEISYDALGRLSEMLTQQRDGGDWFFISKTVFAYDTKSNITATMSVWNLESNTWLDYVKYEYVFGTDGKLEEISIYGNFDTPPVWQNAEKYEYTYNEDGDLQNELLLWWDEETNEWVNHEKYEYTYDGIGIISMELWSSWNLVDLVWNTSSKVTFSHDDYNNISGYTEYWWEASINDWLVEEKCDYSYNNSFAFDQLLLPASQSMYFYTFDFIIFRHMLLSEVVYESDDENWLEDTRTNYYYSESNTSGVSENKLVKPEIYPNPASNYFIIDLGNSLEPASIELYDIQGKLVLSTKVISNDEVSVAELEKGVYIYKLISNRKTYGGSVIVK